MECWSPLTTSHAPKAGPHQSLVAGCHLTQECPSPNRAHSLSPQCPLHWLHGGSASIICRRSCGCSCSPAGEVLAASAESDMQHQDQADCKRAQSHSDPATCLHVQEFTNEWLPARRPEQRLSRKNARAGGVGCHPQVSSRHRMPARELQQNKVAHHPQPRINLRSAGRGPQRFRFESQHLSDTDTHSIAVRRPASACHNICSDVR